MKRHILTPLLTLALLVSLLAFPAQGATNAHGQPDLSFDTAWGLDLGGGNSLILIKDATGKYVIAPSSKPAQTEATAWVTAGAVNVDGKDCSFAMYALKDANGNPTNYIRLRDLALVLNGTEAQFEVVYNDAAKTIELTSGKEYTPDGSEMSTPFSGDRDCKAQKAVTKVNGTYTDLNAIVLTSDSGGGYTCYKIRDLGKALNFNVGWSRERGVYVETDRPYDPGN